MPQTLNISDFSAGWCPSDDPINGRKNGLLKMDALELDQNGAIRMSGGSSLLFTYAVDAHTIYSKFLKDGQYRYITDTAGETFRNTTSIKAGGSVTRSGFCAAFDFVVCCSGGKRFRDDGTTVTDLGITAPTSAPTTALDGGGPLTGTYTYIQVNVVKSGAYVAKSPASAEAVAVIAAANQIKITPTVPPGTITEVWYFRKGGNLDQYYRVARITSSLSAAFEDTVTDDTALNTGIIFDLTTLTVNSTDLSDDILAVVGPINSRLIYFTKNAINFSLVNSPDSYIPGQSIFYAGGATGAELFLFALKISDNGVMVGTTHGFYHLNGTFVTQPDGTLDVYLRNLNVQNAPISIDACVYDGSVICMTAAGWKITNPGSTLSNSTGYQQNLIDERLDRLYRGETLQGYGGVPIYIIPQYRYSCCVSREKLYVRVPQIVGNNPLTTFTYRMEVFDFKRKYWRALSNFSPLAIYAQEDDSVMGFFDTSHTLRSIDDQFTKLGVDGANQTISFLSMIQVGDKPNNRKDSYTLKLKCKATFPGVTINIYTSGGAHLAKTISFVSTNYLEVDFDLYTSLGTNYKDWQVEIIGAPADFTLAYISIDYDTRPDQLSSLVLIPKGQTASKKRIRTWPFKIDPINNDIVCTPIVDGTILTSQTFSAASVYEQTYRYYFKTDVFGVDYRFLFQSSGGVFEFHEVLPPEDVQVLPVAKRFDQLGPLELARYGNLIEIEVILIAFGGTVIPYTIYLDDVSLNSSNFTVTDGKMGSFSLLIPKNVEGTILRIELGPTNFDFHRLYGRVRVQKSGKDTDRQWITIGLPEQPGQGS